MIEYFTDPVLRAPMLGSMLMCLASSLVGVLVFIRKRSLLGEVLSHASYPGVVISVIAAASFFPFQEEVVAWAVLIGAFCFAFLGLFFIDVLERKLKVKNDAALCFILSLFFGTGILIASRIQTTHALWYKQIQLFLYGQVATMVDAHIYIYTALAGLVILILFLFCRTIQVSYFDRDFASTIGIPLKIMDQMLFALLVLAIVVGIRSVGVVLMAGMLIAPALAARQFVHRLPPLFILSGVFGVISGFFGNVLSIEIPLWFVEPISLPTGPMILLVASTICFFALFFAPGRGWVWRLFRIARFKEQCLIENTLKSFWRKGQDELVSSKEIRSWNDLSAFRNQLILWKLCHQGWLKKEGKDNYHLTRDGWARASHIVRLHRLWEAYLVFLGHGKEKVHRNAEEMEHIITPELEKQLTELLRDPQHDPHEQPIPGGYR